MGTCLGYVGLIAFLVVPTAVRADPPTPCVDVELKAHMQELYEGAIDDAFKARVVSLFDVWMKDYSEDPPERTRLGMVNTIMAYQRARAYAKRWNPPACKAEG